MARNKATDAAWRREKSRKNKALGLCACGGKLESKLKRCKKCRDASKRSIEKNKLRGFCLCGRKTFEGKKYCERCLRWYRERTIRKKAMGLCRCGRTLKYYWMSKCQKCLDAGKVYRERTARKVKKLYRPATEEEKRKYGGKSANKILKEYYDFLY